jgi:hypothetical protein
VRNVAKDYRFTLPRRKSTPQPTEVTVVDYRAFAHRRARTMGPRHVTARRRTWRPAAR